MTLPHDPLGDSWLPPLPDPDDPFIGAYDDSGRAGSVAGLRPPPRIAPPRLVFPVPVDPEGIHGPTPGRARGPHWRRTSPNRYVPSEATFDPDAQRIAEVAARLPEGAAVTGFASLHLARARWFSGSRADGTWRPVPVALGHGRNLRPDPRLSRLRTAEPEIVLRHGIPCTTVLQSVFDEVLLLPDVRQRVAAIEMACFAELTSRSRLLRHATVMRGRRGVGVFTQALALAVEGSESPQEVAMRWVWESDARLPRPLVNPWLFSAAGEFLGRPDLLDAEAGVVGEYDGKHHLDLGQRRKDLDREGRFRRHGLEYFTVVGGELGNRQAVVARMRDARERARANRMPRRWTLTPPPGVRLLDLDQRMALRPEPR